MAPILSDEELALDPYALLGVTPDATEKQISTAYRQQSLKCHPDRNPDNPDAASQFHLIQLAQDILLNPAKRAYLNSKVDEDRRRKEKMAGMEKRRRGMVDELIAREEEAKKAKLARFDAMQQATEEERIKEAGRRMREQAQARAAAASQTQAKVNTAFGAAYSDAFAAFGGGTQDGPQRPHLQPLRSSFEQQDMARMKGTANDEARPPITAEDLRLTLQFPALPTDGLPLFLQSEDAFTAEIRQRYGPVEHVILRQGKPAKQGKKASGKGIKAIIEFKERNWDGCWECWRDHSDDSSPAARPLVPKTKAKWAAVDGQTPAWVAWAQRQRGKSQMATPTSADGATPPRSYTPAASFPAAPSSFPASSAPPTKSNKDDSFESTTLFRMRQLERERMEERLRREEEEE